MTIRTFTADSMKQALLRVREELGHNAVILHTKAYRRRGFLWLGGRQVVEVTASTGVHVLPRPAPRPWPAEAYGSRSGGATPWRAPAGRLPAAEGLRAPAADQGPIVEQLAALRQMVESLVDATQRQRLPDVPESLFQLYTRLIESEVGEDLARQIIARVREGASAEHLADPAVLERRLLAEIESRIDAAGPIRCAGQPRVVALVGPTGVGKTTTIAKLAAIYKLRHGLRVGLVTVDTYRIAAVDQLRRYAEIIDVPLAVVTTADQLRRTLGPMKRSADLILIDTAGRSPRDEPRLRELQTFLEAAAPDEIHLVLSLVASESHLLSAADQFARLGGEHLLLTKLDETAAYGVVLGLLGRVKRRLSYLTTGQKVPDDIEVARPERLALLILGKENIHG